MVHSDQQGGTTVLQVVLAWTSDAASSSG